MSNIGFIGLGIMGRPMAAHLQAAGHKLFLYDIGALPQDMLAAGAVACTSGKDVASQAEIVILMVPDTPQVEAALFSANGVAGDTEPTGAGFGIVGMRERVEAMGGALSIARGLDGWSWSVTARLPLSGTGQ